MSRDGSSPVPTCLLATYHRHAQKAGSCSSGINVLHRWSSQVGKGAELGHAQQVWVVPLWIPSRPAWQHEDRPCLQQRKHGGVLPHQGSDKLGGML